MRTDRGAVLSEKTMKGLCHTLHCHPPFGRRQKLGNRLPTLDIHVATCSSSCRRAQHSTHTHVSNLDKSIQLNQEVRSFLYVSKS